MTAIRPDTDVDDEPAAVCSYCDRPFRSERQHGLHLGEVHGEALSRKERMVYEDADDEEVDELFYFHLKMVSALGVTYAILVIVYMVVLAS